MNTIPAQTTDIRAELKTLRSELIDAYDRLVNTETGGGAKEIRRQIDSILSDTQKYLRKLRKREQNRD
ncbi:hypothetical protein [Ligaoa zhengdingensis]|jgi:hypothetical protein|uniref:hypothetical protein n=1 Tax=Ligaoa zhengdingensis TaxID=2763658 RepID=UPI0031BB5CA8